LSSDSLISIPRTLTPRRASSVRQHAIAAAEVENALAGLRRQPFEHRAGEI
jgi:hypothetical protein